MRCGGERILGVACDDCGTAAPAGEVNSQVVRRRSAVRRIDEVVAAHTPSQGDLPDPSELLGAVEWFIAAVTRFAEDTSSQAAQDLAQSVCGFMDLHSRSEESPRLRPNIALRAAILASTERLVGLWPFYRETLTAPSIREVQRLNKIAQDALDSASAPFTAYDERARALAPLGIDANRTLLERTLGVLTTAHEGTLLDITAVGIDVAERVTGQVVRPGAGAQFLVQSNVASVWLDNERFERTVSEASGFCRLANFDAVLESDLPLHGIAASQRRLAEAVLAFEAVLSSETDEDTLFRRLMKYHAEVYEEVGGPLFAWYLLLSGAKTKAYEKLIADGATALAKAIHARPSLALWFDGSEPFLRNAPSHVGGYDIKDRVVHVTLGSARVSHPMEWFIDRVYTFLESLMATLWALFNELERRDIGVPISETDQRYLGMNSFAMAEVFASMSLGALDSRDDDGDWYFSLPPGDDDAMLKALTLIGIDSDVRSVSVRRAGSEHTLRVPLDAWERYEGAVAEARAENHIVAGLEFRAACTVDGVSALQESDLQSAVGVFGVPFLAGDLSLVPLLRKLDRLALARHYADTHDRIVRALRTLRTTDASERARLESDFRLWMQRDLEMPAASSAVVFRAISACST